MAQHLDTCLQCARAYSTQQALRSALRTSALSWTPPVHLEKRVPVGCARASRADTRAEGWGWLRRGWWWAVAERRGGAGGDRAPGVAAPAGLDRARGAGVLPPGGGLQPRALPHGQPCHWTWPRLTSTRSNRGLRGNSPSHRRSRIWRRRVFRWSEGGLDYLGNRPVAALVYHRQQHFINLFLWPAPPDGDHGGDQATRHGYQSDLWDDRGYDPIGLSRI